MANEIYPVSWWGNPVENGWGGIYYDLAQGGGLDGTSFITTWRTTTDNETITIPTIYGGYNYTVKTSDGQTFTGVTGSQAVTFASAGDYDVSISGAFPRIYFNESGDRIKIIDIKQWGNISWDSFFKSFLGCNNLQLSAIDAPDLSNVTNLQNMFRSCASLNPNISNWNVSNITTMRSMLQQTAFNQNIGIWDITSVSNFQFFLTSNNSLTTTNYDAILIGWEATLQVTYPNGSGYTPTISIDFGNSEYTGGGAAETSRTSLINNFNWTITDGGIA